MRMRQASDLNGIGGKLLHLVEIERNWKRKLENFQQTGGIDGNYTKTLNLSFKTLPTSQEKFPHHDSDGIWPVHKEIIRIFFLWAHKATSIFEANFCSEV